MKTIIASLSLIILLPLASFGQNGGITITDMSAGATAPAANKNERVRQQKPLCKSPMKKSSFKRAKDALANEKYDDGKLSSAKAIADKNCLSTDQVIQLCKMFGFEANELAFAKYAYSKTTDAANYSKVIKALYLEASKKDLSNFINNEGK